MKKIVDLKNKIPKWVLIVVIILIIIIISIFFFNGGNEVKAKYDSDGKPVYIEDSKINDMFSNPSDFKGLFVDLTGQIFTDPETEDGTLAFQMWTDPTNAENDVVVYYDKDDVTLENEDYVKLTGYVYGTLEGENAFGGAVTSPVIVATKLEKSTYMEVVSPTIKSVEFTDKKINQQGYEIEVEKVEFAEDETRVYVTATNNAEEEFTIYTFGITATQNGKQYELSDNWDADYEELQTDLRPGVTSSGVLVFDAMEQEDFNLIIEGASDNWDIDLENYSFELEI